MLEQGSIAQPLRDATPPQSQHRIPNHSPLPPRGGGARGGGAPHTHPANTTQTDSSHWPRVTVVTPSYNQASFLEETIRSVLDQGYPNLEYIVMDGGSTDGSVDIIRRYEPFIDYWESAPDRGQSHAINKGWQRATGEVLAYLNSDDVFHADAIHRSVAYLLQHPEASLVYAFANVVDEHGKLLYRMRPGEIDLGLMLRRNQLPQPTVFFRRELIDHFGLFDESLHFDLEYEFWLRAIDSVTFGRLPTFTADMRIHADCKSARQSESFYPEHLKVLDGVFARPGPWTRDAALRRAAYLPVLVYGSGLNSVFSAEERATALARLRTLPPPPSVQELTSVIAFHDTARDAAQDTPEHAIQADSCGILPSLLAAGIIDASTGAVVRKRVHALALARLASHAGESPVKRVKLLLRSINDDVQVLITRPWWSLVIKSTSAGRSTVSLFHLVRDRALVPMRHRISARRVQPHA